MHVMPPHSPPPPRLLLLLLLHHIHLLSAASLPSRLPPAHPVLRHVGRWTSAPTRTPSTVQVSVPDGPLLGNGDLGVVTAPHRDSYPLSPTSTPGNQTFWLGKNDFWSSNTAVDSNDPADLHCQMAYTILSLGGLTVSFPSVHPNSTDYAATQNISSARITTSVRGGGGGGGPGHGNGSDGGSAAAADRVLVTESFVAANSNVLVVTLTCDGCPPTSEANDDEIVTVRLSMNYPYPPYGLVRLPRDRSCRTFPHSSSSSLLLLPLSPSSLLHPPPPFSLILSAGASVGDEG